MALAKDLSSLPTSAKRRDDGWAPDAEPRFAQVLVMKWAEQNEAAGPKPRATADSRFRHSDAGKCARAIAFAALDLPASDPMDLSGTWNTSLGTVIHELWQEALEERFPEEDGWLVECEPKVTTIDGEGSGHIDAIVRRVVDGEVVQTIAVELKTVGGFAFKMAVGERGAAQGPKHEHVVQTSLNATARNADEAVIVYLSKEAISVNAAKKKGFSELGRFLAEWTIDRDTYEPIAAVEETRISGILKLVDEGTLPARKFPSDELPKGAEIVDPSAGRWEVREWDPAANEPKDRTATIVVDTGTFWACGYCSHQTRCIGTESGRQPIETLVELGGAA